MRKFSAVVLSALIILAVPGLLAARGSGQEVTKEFSGVSSIRIQTVSGDVEVIVHNSSEVKVELYYDVSPERNFEYEMRESRGTLHIEEDWRGRTTSGEVHWTLYVPADIDVDFSTASGDFSAEGVEGDIDVSTASGDLEFKDCSGDIDASTASGDVTLVNVRGDNEISTASGDIKVKDCKEGIELSTASGDIDASNLTGEIELSTASGDVEVEDCRGSFKLSTASGSVEARGIIIEGRSKFSTASGDVEVVLAETSEYDLDLGTASGDVTLDYGGNEIKGYFEFEARKRRGRINSPYDFDGEEEFEHYGQDYVRKWFSRKGEEPTVTMSTASGTVTLKK